METSSSKRAAVLLVAGLFAVTACGPSEVDGQAAEPAADTEPVASATKGYAGDPWEQRARAEQVRRMLLATADGWQREAIERHEQQVTEAREPGAE